MRKIGFIGASDKTNMILCIAKTLEYMGNRVIVVDATLLQKYRYIVPSINLSKSYITSFENVDFAMGYSTLQELKILLGIEGSADENVLPYDYMLIDTDSSRGIYNFNIEESDDNYFFTNFDMYSLKKGIAILKNIKNTLKLTKILCNYNTTSDDENFLNYMSLDAKVVWKDFVIYMPIDFEDSQILEDNQRAQKIRLKKLSGGYQDSIYYIVQNITQQKSISIIKKSIRE